jgi:hypothetical protein
MTGTIPPYLTDLDRWILWQNVIRAGKQTKIPISVRGGPAADVTDPRNWGSHAFCAAARVRTQGAWDGEGIVLGDLGTGEALVGLDLDSCLVDGRLAEWARPYLDALDTYAEVSPSGVGLKLFFRVSQAELPTIRAAFAIPPNMNGRKKTYPNGNGNGTGEAHGPAAEIYLSHRFFTVTGRQWHEAGEHVALIGLNAIRTVAALFGPRETTIAGSDDIGDATAPAPEALRAKLAGALRDRPYLAERWLGIGTGLTDTSRSGFDMSLGSMLKAAGFTYGEMRAAILANPHGAGPEHANDERYFERIWSRSVVPARPQEPEPPPPIEDPGWWHSLEQSIVSDQTDAETSDFRGDTAETPNEGLRDGLIINPPLHWTAPAPLRQWLIDQWIPIGYVTGLYGDGGVGKSLLAQQLLSSTALALPWLGLPIRGGRAFGFMCEDDASELHRRQEGINRAYGVNMGNLEFLRISARLGFDNLLMTFDFENRGKPTGLFAELCEWLDRFRPRLVVLDTLADIFGGNEINRSQARQFVQAIGGNIARRYECAVVMPAHPSISGLNSGAGTSGSTGWNNTMRSRLYVTRPDEESDLRLISRMKSNYAPKGGEITATYENGAFVNATPIRDRPEIEWPDIDAIFAEIDRAWKANDPWSSEPRTRNHGRYIGLWASQRLGVNEKKVGKLVQAWLTEGYLRMELFDAKAKRRGLRVLKVIQP